jgi:hypothetical protein
MGCASSPPWAGIRWLVEGITARFAEHVWMVVNQAQPKTNLGGEKGIPAGHSRLSRKVRPLNFIKHRPFEQDCTSMCNYLHLLGPCSAATSCIHSLKVRLSELYW